MKRLVQTPEQICPESSGHAEAAKPSAGRLLTVAAAYFITGWLGLQISIIGSNITLIWLPTGIAVAALLRWGPRYWPAVWLAALAVNLAIGSSLTVAGAISIGNTLAPVASAALLRRWQFNPQMLNMRDIPVFVAGGALLAMMISASWGVATLLVGGLLPPQATVWAWTTWWLGDAVGVIVAGLALVTFERQELHRLLSVKLRRELGLSLACVALVGWGWANSHANPLGDTAMFTIAIPTVVWLAMRLGPWAASTAVLMLSSCAALGLLAGGHQLQGAPLHQAILVLWSHMTMLAVLTMLVAALTAERRRMEGQLRQSELLYRTIADFTADWEYWLLPDGTLHYMSPSCAQISGYSAAQFYAEPQLLTSIVHPDDALLFDGHRHHLSSQGVPLPIDFRILTQDGETRWVSHVCQPVFDPAGQPLGLRGSNRDITARKEVEAALARTHADLQRFAEVTAHHLQEPARRIANYAERLGKQLAGRIDDAEAQLSLDYIGQQARRQQNLLRDVERYLAADQPRGKVNWVDVQMSVNALLARWKTRIDQAGATITLGQLPPAWIDPPRLGDLFEVALDNALNHGRSAQPLLILIEGMHDGHKTCYIVSDNGPGVELAYRERIFRVFERLAPASEGTGTGIGLAILRRIAESCGGTAWIEERIGGGARLVIELAKEKRT